MSCAGEVLGLNTAEWDGFVSDYDRSVALNNPDHPLYNQFAGNPADTPYQQNRHMSRLTLYCGGAADRLGIF